jgi:peptidoglycan hydrolase CwlO-like protein
MASRITMNTLIPISIVGFIAMGAAWLANVQATTLDNSNSIQEIIDRRDHQHDNIESQLMNMNQKLSRIEGYIERLNNNKGEKHE